MVIILLPQMVDDQDYHRQKLVLAEPVETPATSSGSCSVEMFQQQQHIDNKSASRILHEDTQISGQKFENGILRVIATALPTRACKSSHSGRDTLTGP